MALCRICRFQELESKGFYQALVSDFSESEVASSGERESAFRGSEGLCNAESYLGYEVIEGFLPIGERFISASRMHDGSFDPLLAQKFLTFSLERELMS
jgi:hypothetical protein